MFIRNLVIASSLALVASPAWSDVVYDIREAKQCPLSMSVGEHVEVTLTSNPSVGTSWALTESASNILDPANVSQVRHDNQIGPPGADVTTRWRFSARSLGEGQLSLTQTARTGLDIQPRAFDCRITVVE